jgi:hypothetical protein
MHQNTPLNRRMSFRGRTQTRPHCSVNKVCGSMWVFLGITIGIVVWLFLGNVAGFDKTPWPLASHDMPGRQRQIQDAVNEILAAVAPEQG